MPTPADLGAAAAAQDDRNRDTLEIHESMRLVTADVRRMTDRIDEMDTEIAAGTMAPNEIRSELLDLKAELEIAQALMEAGQVEQPKASH